MNLLERKVLELIGEDVDSPDVFDDDGIQPIRDSVNDAIQEIAILTGGYKRKYSLPLRQGQMFYRFGLRTGYFGWIADVWDTTRQIRLEQTDVVRLSSYDYRWMVGSGFPEAYMQLGADLIGVYKKPSASANVLEVTLVEIPYPYESEDDRVKLRDSFQFAAVHYAVGEFWASRGDAKEASLHGNKYLQALGLKDGYQMISRSPAQQTAKEPWPKSTS